MPPPNNTGERTGAATQADPHPLYFDARDEFARRYLHGEGLEIGPLHQPLPMPRGVSVRYVDRMGVDRLRAEYPELTDWNLTRIDVIDNGERLSKIPAESQDFIVANHFLEHCEDPIRTIETHMSKLRPGGILFYAVPDKRYTFDLHRPATSIEHMISDYQNGPGGSRRRHYEEWATCVVAKPGETAEEQAEHARRLDEEDYSIHMHVWTGADFLRLILECRERLGWDIDIEAAARHKIEFVVLLRKPGPFPEPRRQRLERRLIARAARAKAALGRSLPRVRQR